MGSVSADSLGFALTSPGVTRGIVENTGQASTITWVETVLDMPYTFKSQGDLAAGVPPYIIPAPAELSPTTNARWLTDVVKLNPSCAWPKTNISQPIRSTSNFSHISTISVYIPDFDMDVNVDVVDAFDPGSSGLSMFLSIAVLLP